MSQRSDIEQRITRSAEALARAVRKQLDRWLREGVPLQEILLRLSAFRLPSNERMKLEDAVRRSMEEIAKARSLDLPSEHIETLIAARQISIGNIQHQMRDDLQREVRRALVAGYGPDVLRKRLEERGFENVQTEAQTAVSRFNNLLTFENAAATGTRTFKYFGPVSAITRPFCRAHAGQVFTIEEINQMDNGQGLPVLESLGGYNCRHYWIAVSEGRQETEDRGQRSEVRIGKQTFLMNEEQKRTLFERERSLWIQTPEASAGKSAAWFLTAKPLARAHDGFNERITNQPSQGRWASYRMGQNFEAHADKAIQENAVASRREYAQIMTGVVRNPDSQLYSFVGNNGQQRFALYDERTTWMVMFDRAGSIHTAFRLGRDAKRYWKNKQLIGRASDYIGRFR